MAAKKKTTEPSKSKTMRMTIHLTEDLAQRLRNTVYWLSGPPEMATITALVTEGLETTLARLEKKHNKGKRFKPAREALRGGVRARY